MYLSHTLQARASTLNSRTFFFVNSVDAHNESHRELVGKDINRRLMDRDVAKVTVYALPLCPFLQLSLIGVTLTPCCFGLPSENEEYMRRVTAEKAELDRRAATQKANLRTELEKINEKKAEQSGASLVDYFCWKRH